MHAADAIHPNKTLQAKLESIYALKRAGRVDLSIRPEYWTLLERLGNPHRALPPVIHVAGTNGKGSTIAFMRAILESAGYRVHVYTSPHLIRFNERIVIAGAEIGDRLLETLLDETLAANAEMEQTFFEITTALAFAAFARHPADVLLLETGLGGRLDSTNVVERPLASVITTLSYDHTEFLGGTIAAIAGEKAGIMKRGCPVIVAHQSFPETIPVLRARAEDLDCPFAAAGDGWQMTRTADAAQVGFNVQTRVRILNDLPLPALPGAHQVRNAATAVATLMIQDALAIPDAAFAAGLRSATWPARLQRIESASLPSGWELWLDGGHNDSAAAVLADQARAWAAQDGKDLHIVTAMMGHKDAAAFATPLAPLAASVTCIPLENGHSPEHLAAIWRNAGAKRVRTGAGWGPGVVGEIVGGQAAGRILLTGSLYLAQVAEDVGS